MSDRETQAGSERGARLARAVTLHRAGSLAQAEQAYRTILADEPEQADAIHFCGVLLHQTGRSAEAIAWIGRAIALRPDHPDMHNNLGNVLREAGRADEAVAAYRRALTLDPGSAHVPDNLGSALLQAGRLPEALEALDAAIARDPRRVPAHFRRGDVLRRLARLDEACAAYRRVIELSPDHLAAYARLGQVLCRLGRTDEARESYHRWLERDPGHPVARHLLAACGATPAPPRCPDEYVTTLFDRSAESFDDDLRGLDYRVPELLGEALARHVGPPPQALDVLDAGCGTGLCGPVLRPYASRLTGVDLSAAMLRRAATRGLYEELIQGELTAFLEGRPTAHDLVAAADSLVYFGELRPVVAAATSALQPGGTFVFTLERSDEPLAGGFALESHGRYTHARGYVERTLVETGLVLLALEPVVPRREAGVPVRGWLVVGRRAG